MKKQPDALLVTSVANITYLTGYSNFSRHEREAYIILFNNKKYIITDARYSEAIKAHVAHFQLIERSAENSLEKIFSRLIKDHEIKTLGFESENFTVGELRKLKKYTRGTRLIPTTNHIEKDRIIKTKKELDSIQKACSLGDKAFEHIIKKLEVGVSEKELAFELEFFLKKKGADISFPPIVAFGKNSAIPHHQTSDQRLKTNDIVLLDFGARIENYCSDMTRTVFAGIATNEFKKMYQTVLDAQNKAIEFLKGSDPHIKASKVDRVARKYIAKQGYPDLPHSLGHGIGIEVHEAPHISPGSKDILKNGMVFSVEPGIYIPGFGGVRIEDLVTLENNRPTLLTHAPKHLLEVS